MTKFQHNDSFTSAEYFGLGFFLGIGQKYPNLESSGAKKVIAIYSWFQSLSLEDNLFAVKEEVERVRREQDCLSNACGCNHVLSQHNSTSKYNTNKGFVQCTHEKSIETYQCMEG